MSTRDPWFECSFCAAAVESESASERCQFTNSDDYLCGKPAHAGCVEEAAREAGLQAEKVLCRQHLRSGQWTRPG